MSREVIGRDLGRRIQAAEIAVDKALAEIGGLAAALPDARLKASLAATTAQSAFEGVAASLTALTEARAHLGDTHRTLSALARKLGLQTLAADPLDKPEDRPPMEGAQPPRTNVVNEA